MNAKLKIKTLLVEVCSLHADPFRPTYFLKYQGYSSSWYFPLIKF